MRDQVVASSQRCARATKHQDREAPEPSPLAASPTPFSARPNLAHTRPTSVKGGPESIFSWPKLGQILPEFAQVWPELDRCWPDIYRFRPRTQPNLARTERALAFRRGSTADVQCASSRGWSGFAQQSVVGICWRPGITESRALSLRQQAKKRSPQVGQRCNSPSGQRSDPGSLADNGQQHVLWMTFHGLVKCSTNRPGAIFFLATSDKGQREGPETHSNSSSRVAPIARGALLALLGPFWGPSWAVFLTLIRLPRSG